MQIIKRIYALLTPQERKLGGRIAIELLGVTLLDFVSLASLLPVLYWLLKGGENSRAAIWFSLLAVTLIIVKGTAGIFFSRHQNRYLLLIFKRLSLSIYKSYYSRGLLFIREEGANRLTHDINYISYSFSQSILPSLLRMASDSLLILMVASALAIYDFKTSIILLCSFLPFLLIYTFGVRKRVRAIGKEDLKAKRGQSRVVMDTFKGYTDLQVNGAFPHIKESFMTGLEKIAESRLHLDTLLRLPLFLGELAVVLGLVLLLVTRGGDASLLVGVFAVASFRLLPAVRSIMTGYAYMENATYSLDIIEKALKSREEGVDEILDEPNDPSSTKIFSHLIEFDNITYSFPDGEKIFNNFSCTIKIGEFVGFNGYSGVGKTTLFNILLGFIEPQEGYVRLDGEILSKKLRNRWLKQVGYVSQDVFVFHGTLAENIALGEESIDRKRVEQLIKMVSLDEWLGGLPDGIDTVMSEEGRKLSGGQRQRIGIARALYRKVDVLLLDEATSALDNATEQEINGMLHSLRKNYNNLTILSIAHRDSSLSMCDRVVTIE